MGENITEGQNKEGWRLGLSYRSTGQLWWAFADFGVSTMLQAHTCLRITVPLYSMSVSMCHVDLRRAQKHARESKSMMDILWNRKADFHALVKNRGKKTVVFMSTDLSRMTSRATLLANECSLFQHVQSTQICLSYLFSKKKKKCLSHHNIIPRYGLLVQTSYLSSFPLS